MFDCHVHSSFSGDSEMPAQTACERAIELKLEGLAFTDHLDYDYPNYSSLFDIDFDVYSEYMDRLKNAYSNKLKVLKGIEVGVQPHVIDKSLKIIEDYNFDFVILSVHIIDRQDPYYKEYFIGKTKQQAFGRYLELINSTMKEFKNFDVLGHIGYVRRYCGYDDSTLRYCEYSDILDEILKNVINLGRGIEVNTSGYRGGLGSPIPDIDIIKRYRELGGEIICLGSDSHFAEHIADGFGQAKQLLLDTGFKYTAHFENRNPIFDLI
ncbi:MAG: histidinol-phosphatase HisJ family protein [Bacillota bacterium]|nr:histidinol-phosphatase HisJ family protein [Bacillota bacterium]